MGITFAIFESSGKWLSLNNLLKMITKPLTISCFMCFNNDTPVIISHQSREQTSFFAALWCFTRINLLEWKALHVKNVNSLGHCITEVLR